MDVEVGGLAVLDVVGNAGALGVAPKTVVFDEETPNGFNVAPELNPDDPPKLLAAVPDGVPNRLDLTPSTFQNQQCY